MCNIISAGIYRWESEFENKALDKCHLVSWIQLVLKFLQYMYFPNIKLHWIKFISLKKAIRIKIIFRNCWLFAIKMKAIIRLSSTIQPASCTIGKSLYQKNRIACNNKNNYVSYYYLSILWRLFFFINTMRTILLDV